jgi:hypothetical protein
MLATTPLFVVALLLGQPQQPSKKPLTVLRSSEFWERPGPTARTRGLFKIPTESPFGTQISVAKQLPLDGRTLLVVFDVGSGRYIRILAIYGTRDDGPVDRIDQPGLLLRWLAKRAFGSTDDEFQISKTPDGKRVLYASREAGTIQIGLPDYRRRTK